VHPPHDLDGHFNRLPPGDKGKVSAGRRALPVAGPSEYQLWRTGRTVWVTQGVGKEATATVSDGFTDRQG
jgi:hypothetical protein